MQMVLQIVLLIAGFVALIKGADLFVDGSSSLAAIFKVPSIIIGLTIVAMGTSAPELAVSVSAALPPEPSNEIALSNVVGSNLFNLLMVLGVCALIKPLPIDNAIKKRDFPFSIILTIALFVAMGVGVLQSTEFATVKMGDNVTTLERWMGIALIAIFVVYIIVLIRSALKNKTEGEAVKQMSPLKSVLFVLIGIALIVAGGHFVVESAKYIAAAFGMSETLIGLTIVAVGTSLPELVTSVVASRKGENGLAVGNVVGSNIFNILLILGVSGTIHPIRVNFASMIDIAILIAVSILVFLFSLKNKINRPQGAVMILIYIATMVFAIVR